MKARPLAAAGAAAKVGGEVLKTEIRPTAVRLDLGWALKMDENALLRTTASYRTSGSGTNEYGGGLQVRF